MRKRNLSRRERDMIESAITRMCRALGVSQRDEELRQIAWVEILSVYQDDPRGFQGGSGWRRACGLAGDAILREVRCRQRQIYGQRSLDEPVRGDTEATLLQLLHAPSGNFENSVCLWDYLSRLHPDVQRTARGMMEGETLSQLRGCYGWSQDYACWARSHLVTAMEEYLRIE